MTTLQGQIEKMARDITSGPDLSDSIEVAVVGAALGAIVGYIKDRDGRTAKSFAAWGAGLGVAGQYLLYHALKPAMRHHGMHYVGEDMYPATGCPKGSHWSDWAYWEGSMPHGGCVQDTPPPPPPVSSLSEHRAGIQSGPAIVGAVAGLGGFRGGQMPFGPGPWPTQDRGNPNALGWG
ncbi:MAG TPA: hypothetical protein VFA98_05140 [Thermoanaerobaculia bacterium]|nr:hypothetical protein [Thermoanaerobaculia bacterium]